MKSCYYFLVNSSKCMYKSVNNSKKALVKPIKNFNDIIKENKYKINLKPAIYIYEKCTYEGFKIIGGFTSSKKIAKFLETSTNKILYYKNSGLIFKGKYKITSNII